MKRDVYQMYDPKDQKSVEMGTRFKNILVDDEQWRPGLDREGRLLLKILFDLADSKGVAKASEDELELLMKLYDDDKAMYDKIIKLPLNKREEGIYKMTMEALEEIKKSSYEYR